MCFLPCLKFSSTGTVSCLAHPRRPMDVLRGCYFYPGVSSSKAILQICVWSSELLFVSQHRAAKSLKHRAAAAHLLMLTPSHCQDVTHAFPDRWPLSLYWALPILCEAVCSTAGQLRVWSSSLHCSETGVFTVSALIVLALHIWHKCNMASTGPVPRFSREVIIPPSPSFLATATLELKQVWMLVFFISSLCPHRFLDFRHAIHL